MEQSRGKWSLYSLGRRKPYLLVLIAGGFLFAAAIPDTPFAFLSLIAFVPLFILFEVLPVKVPEDKILFPFKAGIIILFRLLTLQFIWRRGVSVFRYERKIISGNAQLFRFTYLAFFIRNSFFSYWILIGALDSTLPGEQLNRLIAGLTALLVIPALQAFPFQFYSRMRHVFSPPLAALSAGIIFVAFEYFYLLWNFNWPWAALGNTFNYHSFFIQYASLTGALGVTLFIFLANLASYQILRYLRGLIHDKKVAILSLIWILPMLFALVPSNNRDLWTPGDETLTVRVLSPELEPRNPLNTQTRVTQLQAYLDLLPQDSTAVVDWVVLPELALIKPLRQSDIRNEALLDPLWKSMEKHNFSTLLGYHETEFFKNDSIAPWEARKVLRNKTWFWREEYNSVALLTSFEEKLEGDSLTLRRRRVQSRRKSKRALFTETMPMGNVLRWLAGRGVDLSVPDHFGKGDSLYALGGETIPRITPLIGMEGAYGSIAAEMLRQGSICIFWLQDYGDYRRNPGFFLDAGMARMRAVESDLPLIRISDTGGAELISGNGKVLQLLQNAPSADFTLSAIREGFTQSFYTVHGDWLGSLAAILALLFTLWALFLEIRRKRSLKNGS